MDALIHTTLDERFAIPTPATLDELSAMFEAHREYRADSLEAFTAATSFVRQMTAGLGRAAELGQVPKVVGSVDRLALAIKNAEPSIFGCLGASPALVASTTPCAARLVTYLGLPIEKLQQRWASGEVGHDYDALVLLQSSLESVYRYSRICDRMNGGFVPELAFRIVGDVHHLH